MNKMTHTKFNLNNFLMSLSSSLDNTIQNNKHNTKYSSKRVAYIALNIASAQNLEKEILSDIFSYSIIFANTVAIKNINSFTFNTQNILKNKTINDIVSLAYEIEQNLDIKNNIIVNKDEIISSFSQEQTSTLFNTISFWYDLTSDYQLPFYIFNHLFDFTLELEFEKLINLTQTINDIIYSHSRRSYLQSIANKCKVVCEFYGFDSKDTARMIISSNLINIGLLHIPSNILQKETSLDSNEFGIMMSVPYHTNSVLSQVFGFDDIALLASSAYEKLNGSGYPYKTQANNLSLKNRIISILTMYQALCEKRIYRESFSKEEIIKILKEDSKDRLDISVINDISKIL